MSRFFASSSQKNDLSSKFFDLKESLLKAANLQKNRSQLVLVQRTVTKRGKTFTQHFWIKPSEVKDTDQVLLNKQNLPKGHSQRPDDVANPHSPRKYDDPIKQKTQDYFFSFKNVGECLAALKTQGIEWKEPDKNLKPSVRQGLTVMRAKMALNAAIHNGYTPVKPTDKSTSAEQSNQSSPSTNPAESRPSESKPAEQSAPPPQPLTKEQQVASKQQVKSIVANFQQEFAIRNDFLDALEKLGVQWNHSDHAGINLMRAKMAASKAVANGFNLSDEWKKTQNGDESQQPQNSTQQSTSKPTPPTPLTAKQQAISKQQVKNIVANFQQEFAIRNDFLGALEKMGVQWNHSDHAGINLMRAKMAASKAVANGFNLSNEWKKTQNGDDQTASSQSSQSDKSSKAATEKAATEKATAEKATAEKATAEKAATEKAATEKAAAEKAAAEKAAAEKAAAEKVAAEKAAAEKAAAEKAAAEKAAAEKAAAEKAANKSLLKVPKDATPAQKELIKHINNMTDYKTIINCSLMGMVPEDDAAAEYITGTLGANLRDWVNGKLDMDDCPEDVKKQYTLDMANIGEDVKDIASTLWSSNSDLIVDSLKIKGCKPSIISTAMSDMFKSFNMAQLVTPHKFITSIGEPLSEDSISEVSILNSLTNIYSDYTTDKQFPDGTGKTNLGYTGYRAEEYKKRYDPNKEGLVRFLQKVKQDNAGNVEVAAEVDRMIHDYNEAMKLVGGNKFLLDQVIQNKSIWNQQPVYSPWDFGGHDFDDAHLRRWGLESAAGNPRQLKVLLEGAEAQSDALLKVLQGKGYSTDRIIHSLLKVRYNDDLANFVAVDGSGNKKSINIYDELTNSKTGTNPLSQYGPAISENVKLYTIMKLLKKQEKATDAEIAQRLKNFGVDGNQVSQLNDWMKNAKLYAQFSESDANRVIKLIDGIFEGQAANPSAAKTVIMANALMATKFNTAATDIAQNVTQNPKGTQNAFITPHTGTHEEGFDFSKNFDFYSPEHLEKEDRRSTNAKNIEDRWRQVATYTAQELSDKITSQLNSTPSYSADYIQQLTQYYTDKAKASGGTESISSLAQKDTLPDTEVTGNLNALMDSPVKDVVHKTVSALVSHVPTMAQSSDLQRAIDKKLNYSPYNFNAATQHSSHPNISQNQQTITPEHLRLAREKLFDSAVMSLGTENEQVSEQMRKDMNENRLDYKNGEQSPDGKVFSGPIHTGPDSPDNRCFMYNTRFFKVNNSVWEERFKEKQAELKAAHPDNPEMWTAMDLFHGTSRASAGSILGRSAGWWMGGGEDVDYTKAGKMLGPGAYFGYKVGKSSVYIGNTAYANIQFNSGRPPKSGAADGVLIMANVMRGDNFIKKMTDDASYSSVSTDSVNDWEMAVRDNALIFPHHFVDMSCRALNKNVKVDANGNYLDENGNITHESNGKSVIMK